MDMSFLHSINYLAVLASSVALFIIGSVWYSPLLMSTIWVEELKKHQVTIKQPTSSELGTKMFLTFVTNVIASFAMACLVILVQSITWQSGVALGVTASIGFSATALASICIWQSRSLKLFLIDAGYPVVGSIASGVILSLWR